MKLIRSPGIAPLILGVAAALGAGFALSQPYPACPIRVVVPWPAGGLVDAAARAASHIRQIDCRRSGEVDSDRQTLRGECRLKN